MMEIHLPWLQLTGPLRSRPIYGTILGACTGAVFGTLAAADAFPVDASRRVLGYTIGGAIAGFIGGAAMPLLTRRWVAGLVACVATSPAIYVAEKFWGTDLSVPEAVFTGVCGGLIYGVLLWDYRPASNPLSKE